MALPGTFFCSACNQFLPLAKLGRRKATHRRCVDCVTRAQAAQAQVEARKQARQRALSRPSQERSHADR